MRLITGHIILFLLYYNCAFINAQTANTKINTDSINISFLESLIKTKVDSVRQKNNKKILTENDTLKKAIDDQINYVLKTKKLTHFQTKDSGKYSVSQRIAYYGMTCTYTGENIAYTFIKTKSTNGSVYIISTYGDVANEIVKLWVNSAGHFDNMTKAVFTKTAVAVRINTKTKVIYAGQVFSSK